MQKTVLTLLSVVFLLQLARLPALALDVIVRDNGTVYFYEGQILGDDDQEEVENELEDENEDEQDDETEQENKANELEKRNREQREKRIEAENKTKPVKIVPKTQKTQLRVSSKDEKVQIRLEKKSDQKNKTESSILKSDMMEDKRFRIEIPVQLNESESDEVDATESAKVQRVREERQQRETEKFEIQSEVNDDGTVQFQFESRNVKAKLNGAQFTIDPATNIVTLVTPSGNVHQLNHLPDQAINNMIAAGVIRGVTPSASKIATDSALPVDGSSSATVANALESELELVVNDDGNVAYSTTVKKPKKLLGLFRRDVLTTVELDDTTGEIRQTEVRASNLLGQLLNFMSL